MYFILGASLTLAFLLIVNMIVAIFASALWRSVSRRVEGLSVRTQGQIIFGLRVLPVAAALVFVLAFLIPSYLLHEPISSGETISGKLALIALISSLGVSLALYRVVRTWTATRRLAANWQSGAVQINLGEMIPIYRIKHRFPVIAVIGVVRPRMFVAKQVLDSLDGQELRAAIAHEYGHLKAKDNFKRTLLRICRDVLIVPLGEELDRAWAENAESVADEHAAKTGGSTALDLASALLKIARIAPTGASPAMPAGAFLVEESVDVTSRVRRLMYLSENQDIASHAKKGMGFSAFWLWSTALTLLIGLPLADQRLLSSTHEAIEQFVRILQ